MGLLDPFATVPPLPPTFISRPEERPLPPDPQWYFVPRGEVLEEIKAKLLGNRKTVALVGMVGTGKSSLAAEVARDPEVLRVFADGVFWLSLGQDRALLLPQIRELLYSLGDTRPPPEDFKECSKRLNEVLRGRRTLLALDDAWAAEDVRLFLHPGESKIMLTTRDWVIAESLDAWKEPVEPFTKKQALTMIERRMEGKFSVRDREHAKKVGEMVGWLPLSLAAACARVEDTGSWRGLVEDLGNEVKRLRALDPPENGQSSTPLSVASAFALSLGRLDKVESNAFAVLSLLAEDVTFTADVAMNLWHLSREDADARLRRLRRKELIRGIRKDDSNPSYQLHDEQRNAGSRLLNLTPPQRHRRLLDEYRQANKPLSSVSDDGYIHDHLAWHLVEAQLSDELHRILREEKKGVNVWFSARRQRLASYLDDLQLATSAARHSVGLVLRYAMMRSSVASLESAIPWGLLVEFAKRSLWSEERAWAHVISLPPRKRTAVLRLFIELFDNPFRSRCFTSLLADIQDAEDHEKMDLFLGVPHVLSRDQMDLLLQTAKQVNAERSIAVVAALCHFASADRIEELFRELDGLEKTDLGVRHGMPWTVPKLLLFVGLPHFLGAASLERLLARFRTDGSLLPSGAQRFAQLGELDRALSIVEEWPYEDSVVLIAKDLRIDQIERAKRAAEKIQHEPSRALALAAVHDCQPEPLRLELLNELWATSSRAARSLMTPYLSVEMIRHLALPDSNHQRSELIKRLVYLGLTERALELLGPPSRRYSSELAMVAAVLPDADIMRLGVNDPKTDPWVLAALLPRWVELHHIAEALALLPALGVERSALERCVSKLAPHLDDDSLVDALRACESIGHDVARLRCQLELAIAAPHELESELIALPIEDLVNHQRVHHIARRLNPATAFKLRKPDSSPLYRLAIGTAHEQFGGSTLLDDLTSAVDYIEKTLADIKDMPLSTWLEHYWSLGAALDYFVRALEICTPDYRDRFFELGLRALSPFGLDSMKACLAFHSVKAVVAAAMRREHGQLNRTRLCSLAAALEGQDQVKIEDLFLASFGHDEEFQFVEAIADAKEVTPRLLSLALAYSRKISGTLGLLGPSLVEQLAKAGRIADAVEIAARVGDPVGAFSAQVSLAVHAPAPSAAAYLDKAWAKIFRDDYTNRDWNDASHIGPLIPRVLEQPREVIETLWRHAVRVLARQPRQDMFEYLAPLAPVIRVVGGSSAVVDAYRAAEDVARWWH